MRQAVVMAGGRGTRLAPLTDHCPKPLLPLGDRTILDCILEGLGDRQITISINYLGGMIRTHLGDSVTYVEEIGALGTAGSLALMARPAGAFIVMNGDIITDIDYDDLVNYHDDHCYDMTVAIQRHAIRVKYGVVNISDGRVMRIDEKPKHRFHINAGIYVLEPSVLEYVDGHYDMTDLIDACLSDNLRVGAYVMDCYWRDVGSHYDYKEAQDEKNK